MEGKLRHRQGRDLPGSQLGNGKGGSDAGKPTPRPHSKLPDDPNLPAFVWELIIASETRGFINPQCPVMPGPVAAMLPPQSGAVPHLCAIYPPGRRCSPGLERGWWTEGLVCWRDTIPHLSVCLSEEAAVSPLPPTPARAPASPGQQGHASVVVLLLPHELPAALVIQKGGLV